MEQQVDLLVSVRLTGEFLNDYGGVSPEDIAYYFVDALQDEFVGGGVHFEVLEVY